MAKQKMKKIEIIGLLEDCDALLSRLQRCGVVEISDEDDSRLFKPGTKGTVAELERNISLAKTALEIINKHCGGKSGFAVLKGKSSVGIGEFSKLSENNDKILGLCRHVVSNSKKIESAQNEIAKKSVAAESLKPWFSLDIPKNFGGTVSTKAFIGTLPMRADEKFLKQSLSLCGDAVCAEVVSFSKQQTKIAVLCHKSLEQSVSDELKNMGFVKAGGDSFYTAREESEYLKKEIDETEKTVCECEERIKSFANRREEIKFLIDSLSIKRDKYAALENMGMSERTVVINGFVPEVYADDLAREIEKDFAATITVADPCPDDDVPVALTNGRFSEPMEGITKMYSLPGVRDIDPSAVMAFFYYLFFGMMLSDAGYGILMFFGTTFALRKFTFGETMEKSLRMFKYCGISTVFWGALFGSWFGDLPQVILSNFFGKEVASTALWFEPLKDPIKLLLISFGLGIVHLFLGLAVNFYMLWKEGSRLDAFLETIPIYMTVLGVAPIAASILVTVPQIYCTLGKYVAAAGTILIVLTFGRRGKNVFLMFFGGLYGLYNVATGYLSDILSYSRLLALGLATGSIASVINLIVTMPQNTVLKAVLLLTVGVLGHVANLGINMLGAYVHSDRLQFVELFSKFYEGGGREFAPFKINTQYIKFAKENSYE